MGSRSRPAYSIHHINPSAPGRRVCRFCTSSLKCAMLCSAAPWQVSKLEAQVEASYRDQNELLARLEKEAAEVGQKF